MKKVVCAMSGGVDSSVAAALLKKQGFDVMGITLKLFCYAKTPRHKKACCSIEAIKDARQVCQKLNIPHYVINCEKEFKKWVIDNFISEYRIGLTPNPCVRCNQFIKFDWLIKKAKSWGADYIATGHYVKKNKNNKLLTAKDKEKDQSYFLYTLTQKQLKHILFPLGDYAKQKVRKLAKKFGLAVYNKKGSQEICFVENKNLTKFLQKHIKVKPGNIKDIHSREVLGKHLGIWTYTIGQRAAIGGGGPYYVIGADSKKNTIWVTNKKTDSLLYRKEFCVKLFNWVPGKKPKFPLNCRVRTRYRNPLVKCRILKRKGGILVLSQKPIRAITFGQSAVFYKNKEVLGGGIIVQDKTHHG